MGSIEGLRDSIAQAGTRRSQSVERTEADTVTLAQLVRTAHAERIGVTELAELAKVSRATIYAWIRGE